MNVLSLFDGMSCGQIALDQLGIPVNKYFAAEIDKYAIQVAKKNYPNMIHLGDVKNVKTMVTPNDTYLWMDGFDRGHKIDLLIGGSPCQGFSFGGKGLNFDDPRSKLFFEFDRLLKALKPKYFLLENVKMKKESEQVITDYLGVEPIEINSNLVSAQNRKRLYWTNIPMDGLPEDKGIMLKDILEEETAEFYRAGEYLQEKRRTSDKNPDMLNPDYRSQANTIHDVDGKSGTVCAGTHGYAIGYVPEPKGARIVNRRLDERGKRQDYNKDIPLQKRLELRTDDKSNCLTTVHKDSVLADPVIRDKSECVRTGGRLSYDRHEWDSIDNMHWRKLTVTECERLQTVPDGYTCGVSNTQRYKMLGNGWTVDVIKHIFEGLKEETI
jgi:DNA (cytosine-5)-methyltransferase 3A